MSERLPQLWPMMRRVERSALTTLSQCLKLLGLTELPLPVPVEAWVESPLGLRFGVCDLSHLGPTVLGVARPKEREILVSETIAGQESRFRFTIAHELGHIVLHAKIQPEFRELAEGDYLAERFEREADRFAASLLMPLDAFGREFTASCSDLGLQANTVLHAIQNGDETGLRLFRSRIVQRLSRRFGVSLSAATYRFADIQLDNGLPALTVRQARSLITPSPSTPDSRQPR
ncbi:MAG: ImmA/IrrE family metallo-endopeptidase [Phycisphaerales bacterium]|nr:ImmA/IrrE family metallo-endopeptidase [Phycisphaerales bacterium]